MPGGLVADPCWLVLVIGAGLHYAVAVIYPQITPATTLKGTMRIVPMFLIAIAATCQAQTLRVMIFGQQWSPVFTDRQGAAPRLKITS